MIGRRTRTGTCAAVFLLGLLGRASAALALTSFGPAGTLNSTAGTDEDVDPNVSGSGARDARISAAGDGEDNWVAVWDTENPLGGGDDDDLDVVIARSTDNGQTWSAPVELGRSQEPGRVVTNGAGT